MDTRPARLGINTRWNALGSISLTVAKFASTAVILRWTEPAEAGRVLFLLWLVESTYTLTGGGLPATILQFTAELKGAQALVQAEGLFRHLLLIHMSLALIGAAGIWCIATVYYGYAVQTASWAAALLLLTACGTAYVSFLVGTQRLQRFAFLGALSGSATIIATFAAYWFSASNAPLKGLITGACILAGACVWHLNTAESITREFGRQTVGYSSYSVNAWIASVASAMVWSRSELFFLEKCGNSKSLAAFSLGVLLSTAAITAANQLTGAMQSHFAEAFGASDAQAQRSMLAVFMRVFCFVLFPVTTILASATPTLLLAVFPTYSDSAAPIAILTVTGAFGFSTVASAYVYSKRRAAFIALSSIFGAAASILLGLVLVPIWGLWGAIIGRIALQLLLISFGLWYVAHKLECNLPLGAMQKLALAAISAAFVAYVFLRCVPGGLPALTCASLIGACAYLAVVRWLHALESGDVEFIANFLRCPSLAERFE